jgi:aminoglycoside phosphotransferase (APT) family kinase protein
MSRVPDHAEWPTRLAGFIAGAAGLADGAVEVRDLRRLAGGSSREIWAFVASLARPDGEQTLDLVMRRDPAGRVEEGSRDVEFRVVQAAFEAGVPVPRPHYVCVDPEVLGTPFYLMDRVDGEALPRRLLRDERYGAARERMTGQLAEILAGIHRIDPDQALLRGVPEPARASSGSPAEADLALTTAALRELAPEPHPVLELADRWLRARLPARSRRSLVHGDYRVGNVIFDEQGVRAIVDWELSRIGDPVEDLGWLCTRAWRFGNDDQPVGGIGSREELLAAYRAAGGDEIDPQHLLFWEAMGTYKVALVFLRQSRGRHERRAGGRGAAAGGRALPGAGCGAEARRREQVPRAGGGERGGDGGAGDRDGG